MRVVSLATWPTLPQARVLARSIREHEPEWSVTVAVISSASRPLPAAEPFRALAAAELLDVDLFELIDRHGTGDLLWLLAPRLMQWACAESDGPVLYLGCGTWVCGELSPVADGARSHGIALVPRSTGDLPDDELGPSQQRLLEQGRLSASCVAVDGGERGQQFLGWWADRTWETLGRLGADPRDEVHPGDRGLAHGFLELAPSLFGARVLEDPGLNVSAWNLHGRSLAPAADGVLADGAPLRFMDLEGFEPDRPWRLRPEATRVRVSESPVLYELSAGYAAQLLAAGWRDFDRYRDVGSRLANGLVFDDRLRRLLTDALAAGEDFGDIFTERGTAALMAWVQGPAARGGAAGITRYLYRVYRDRLDLPLAYPDLNGANGPEYAAWCWVFGQYEMDIPVALLPPPPDSIDAAALSASGREVGVRVSGYLGHTLGLGSAARGYVSALRAAEVAVSTLRVPLSHLEVPSELAEGYGEETFADLAEAADELFELVCVNPDELPLFAQRLEEAFSAGRTTIGIWGWETNTIPERWAAAFDLVDEIWVYSRFMAENLGRVAPVPVVCLAPPVQAPEPPPASFRLGVGDGYLFLFVFDYLSTVQRKNPVGLIESFKRAFAPGEGPQLLIKTLNGPLRPQGVEEVLWAAAGRPDIHVVDRSLDAGEKDALMASCDCYVSLHRAEGFGLTLAEAMSLGKPVIGTAYSGNTDFMTPGNSYLVDYTLTRVGAECEIYPADGEWAEPSIEHAAQLMREVWEHPGAAAGVGRRARADILRMLSPAATGQHMRARLERLAWAAERRASVSALRR